jgi:integrase
VLAPATIYTTEECYRLRIAPELGHLALDEISREVVERWLNGIVAAATSRRIVTKTVAALRVILQAAVDWQRLAENPAANLRLPPVETHTEQAVERVLTPEQFRRLLSDGATSLRHETMFRAAGEAGLRRGEIIAVRWPDVRLDERRIEVRRSIRKARSALPANDRETVEKSAKGRRQRRVAISETFAARLAAWHAESVVEGGAEPKGEVWPGSEGGPMAPDTPSRALERALLRCGLVDEDGAPLVTFHGLRHAAVSIMLAAGGDAEEPDEQRE